MKENEITMDITDGSVTAREVTLDMPVIRGKNTIEKVTIRKPTAGELRGIKLQSLMESDTNSIMALLPRITSPALTAAEVNNLDSSDLWMLGNEIVYFLLPKSVRADLGKI
ncbi:TPA: phage tail assembly protein [Salmonella enterica subsp. enterica serovar Virchow]|nr:phage tail assembly protein [Salmonella enterica]HAK6115612.1 phage tail assembly protein [Salmonella enterica]HEC8457742.1 phage tail assembly protein [Salmonella enterica subsp. enterica serovar Poona]